MGRLTRNRELLSAYKSPELNTAAKRVVLDAMDDTQAYNEIRAIGELFNEANNKQLLNNQPAGDTYPRAFLDA